MKTKNKKRKTEGGYSLIELLVAVGVFAVVVTITSGTFITSLKGQQKAITAQNAADNARYAMEIMAKEMRMGRDFVVTAPDAIQFVSNMPNRAGKTVRFRFDSATAQIMFDDDISFTMLPEEPITASNSAITALQFTVSGENNPANQPRITIVFKASSAGMSPDVASSITLQTTVSPRSL